MNSNLNNNNNNSNAVYPLAFPKGIKYLCELCQKPAHRVCEKCRVTYYWYFSILLVFVNFVVNKNKPKLK
jgi:hypothetical protein